MGFDSSQSIKPEWEHKECTIRLVHSNSNRQLVGSIHQPQSIARFFDHMSRVQQLVVHNKQSTIAQIGYLRMLVTIAVTEKSIVKTTIIIESILVEQLEYTKHKSRFEITNRHIAQMETILRPE
jgi:hypothetical protein